MEPLMSYDGFVMLQDDRKSRDLLNDYFRNQGYTVHTHPAAHTAPETTPQPETPPRHDER